MTKNVVRVLSILLVILCILSVQALAANGDWYSEGTAAAPAAVTTAKQSLPFPDVAKGIWYYDDLLQLYSGGVVNGFTDGKFHPERNVTSGEALKMILLAAGYPEPARVSSHWARGYLNLALEEGFVERYVDISDLDVAISRGLVAKITAQALHLEVGSGEGVFNDCTDGYAVALNEAGIINGYPDHTFRPKNAITRAEMAAITARIYRYEAALQEPDEQPPEEDPHEPIVLRTTESGVEMLKSLEGFVEKPYWDYLQYSVGYGSRCEKDDYPDGISKSEADYLLRRIIKDIEKSLDAFLSKYSIKLSDSQYDALVSFTYNNGSTWMKSSGSSRLASLLAGKKYSTNEFASAMGIWCHVTTSDGSKINDSLITRRIREIKLFLYGDYSGKGSHDFCWVKFDGNGGSREVDIAMYEKGTKCSPFYSASRSDGDFLGWYIDGGSKELTEKTVINQNLTVVADWELYEEEEPEDIDEEPEEDEEEFWF